MKFDIEWHEITYKNWSAYIEKERSRIKDEQLRLEHEEAELAFYQLQIDSAKKSKKDGFDKYKYLVKNH